MSRNVLSSFRLKKCLIAVVLASLFGTSLIAFYQKKATLRDKTEPLRKALGFDVTRDQAAPNDIEFTETKDDSNTRENLVKFLPSQKKPVTEALPAVSSSQAVQDNFQKITLLRQDLHALQQLVSQAPYYPQFPQQRASTNSPSQPPYIPKRRLVHLDLKGAPPKVEYLRQIFPLLVKLGATGLLLEYEDMFPYDGPLRSIAAKNHYTKEEVTFILDLAYLYNLEVIPLVQTFGHLEFVLKLEPFSVLRENPDEAQAICPSRNESLYLVEVLVDQVMQLHPKIQYIHIGCDEVFQFGKCSLCSQQTKEDLFLGHVTRVANYVRNKYRITPIIWDDMLRSFTLSSLQNSGLGSLVEPMVWVYAEDVYHFVSSQTFSTYSQVFPAVWGSSAYKGAFGETLVVPNVKRHLENNQNWLIVAREEGKKFSEGFRGLALTGWQRYDHFSSLCELLPAGIPSLATNLLATSRGYLDDSLAPVLYTALNCTPSPRYTSLANLQHDPFLHEKMAFCFFPGMDYFRLTSRFIRMEKEIDDFVYRTTRFKGWMTDYNLRRNFSSGARVEELTRDLAYFPRSLLELSRQIARSLGPIFDKYTVSEWMELKLLPLFEKLDQIRLNAVQLKAAKTWQTRPLPVYAHWNYYGVFLDQLLNETRQDLRRN